MDELEAVLYIDPAIKAGKRNDYSAITILGRQEKTGQMLVLDGSIHKLLPDALFDVAIEKLNLFPVEKIGFEATQAQSYMKQMDLFNHTKESVTLFYIGIAIDEKRTALST